MRDELTRISCAGGLTRSATSRDHRQPWGHSMSYGLQLASMTRPQSRRLIKLPAPRPATCHCWGGGRTLLDAPPLFPLTMPTAR